MADMRWKYSDVWTKVSEQIGTGSTPTGTDLTTAKDIVRRGYLKFLMPIKPGDREIYIWSWLKEQWKLNLEPDKWVYPLPIDFDRFFRKLEYDKEQRNIALSKVSEASIMRHRSNLVYSSYPTDYAVRAAKFDKAVGSVKEMIVYPTPTARSVINATYVFTPDQLENDGDYFIGGAQESEAILQCCLAVAENQEDEVIGLQTQKAVEMIQLLIMKDMGEAPDSVGTMHTSETNGSLFSYRDCWIPSGTYTVYGYEI
jgi:hypothetical protein